MNFLKTTALGFVLCLGLVPTVYSATAEDGSAPAHTLRKDGAAEEEGQEQHPRLTHHQMLQLGRSLAAWEGFSAERLRVVQQFVTGAGVAFPDDQAYGQFASMQQTLVGPGNLSDKVTAILSNLGLTLTLEAQLKTNRGAGLIERTMDIITFMEELEGSDAVPLNAFKKFLATEMLLATEGTPLPKVLAFLGVEVELAARALSSSKFREISASFRVNARKSVPELTALLINTLGDLVSEEDREAFNRLLKTQYKTGKIRLTPEIGEFVEPLGMTEADLARIPASEGPFNNFKVQMDHSAYYELPVLKKTRLVLDALTQGGKLVSRDTLETLLQETSLGENGPSQEEEGPSNKEKAASVLQQLVNANLVVADGAEETIRKAVANADRVSSEMEIVLELLMNGTVTVRHPESMMSQETAAPYYKLLAVEDALNKSSGSTGLKAALSILGFAVQDAAPKAPRIAAQGAAASKTVKIVLQDAAPKEASPAGLSLLTRGMTPSTPGSVNRFGYRSPSSRPQSAGVTSVSEALKNWAATFAANPGIGAPEFKRPEAPIHVVPPTFGSVTKALDEAVLEDGQKDQVVPPSVDPVTERAAPVVDAAALQDLLSGDEDSVDGANRPAPTDGAVDASAPQDEEGAREASDSETY